MRRWIRAVAPMLAGLLLLTACGGGEGDEPGDGGDEPAGEDGEQSDDGAAAGEPLRIGLLLPSTGVLAENGNGNADGFNFYWEEMVDSQSGDRPVEIIAEDSEGDPETALTRARKLVEQDDVHVVTGIVSSAAALAVQDYLASQDVPLVIHQAAASDVTSQPVEETSTARVIATFRQTMLPFARWIGESEGHQDVFFLGSDYAAGEDAEQAVRDGVEEAGGTVVDSLFPPLGTQDFGPFINQIDQSADAVVTFFGGTDAQRFMQQYEEFGLGDSLPLYGHWALTVGPLLEQAGDEALDIVTVQEYLSGLDVPGNDDFVSTWTDVEGGPPNSWNEQGYTAALLIDEIAQRSSGEALELAEHLGDLELDSPRGQVTFDENGQIVEPIYVARVQEEDGAMRNVEVDTLGDVSQADVTGE